MFKNAKRGIKKRRK